MRVRSTKPSAPFGMNRQKPAPTPESQSYSLAPLERLPEMDHQLF